MHSCIFPPFIRVNHGFDPTPHGLYKNGQHQSQGLLPITMRDPHFLSPSQQLSSINHPTQGYTIPTFITFINHVTWECYSGSHISHLGPMKHPHVESPASNGVAEHSTYLVKESSNWGKRSNENGSETRSETRIQKYGVCNRQNERYININKYIYIYTRATPGIYIYNVYMYI